jgi:Ca2+-binding EF-hand superfamily protein
MIEELFNLEALTRVSKMIANGAISMDNAEDTNITNLNLFRMFKKYDRNLNGVLEITEYIDCMKAQDEDFSEQEIVSLALMADINGDNSIDYEEFMKHFVDMLKRIRFMTVIQ